MRRSRNSSSLPLSLPRQETRSISLSETTSAAETLCAQLYEPEPTFAGRFGAMQLMENPAERHFPK